MTIDRDGKPASPDRSGTTACPYAVFAAPLAAALCLFLAFLAAYLPSVAAGVRPFSFVGQTARLRPPAQAPPVFLQPIVAIAATRGGNG